jgi:tRNA pseudouridine38-40 synthase
MFWGGRAWCLPQTLDLELAEEAAHLFKGELDFSTFSYRMQEMETRVRTVSAIAISGQKADLLQGEATTATGICADGGPRLLRLSITANGFLRRMVRLIAAGVVEVALGQRSLLDLQSRLQARDPSRAPHPAPPEGLYLERVVYDPDPFTSHRGTSRHALATLPTQHRVKR